MDQNLLLAVKRTMLSAKRTLLSFIRTALLALSVALAFIKLDKEHPLDFYSIALLIIAAAFIVVGVMQYVVAVLGLRAYSTHQSN